MRRLFVFILTLIVTAASAAPCCSYDACADEAAHASSEKIPAEKGVCSPFFNCAGCAGFVHVPRYIYIAGPVEEGPSHYEQAMAFSITAYFSPFFQPPRHRLFIVA